VTRIFPMPRALAQRMAHRPDMLGRARLHFADAQMLEDAERDAGEEALRLRRAEEHHLIFIIFEPQRLDPAGRRLGHMVERYLPAELVALGDERFGPGAGD